MEFNWNENDSIVIRKMDAVAVYKNPHDQIVIRQENEFGDGDAIIILNVDGARILAEALVKEADELTANQDCSTTNKSIS